MWQVGHDSPTCPTNNDYAMTLTNVRYSILLNDTQYDYLLDEGQDINRMRCLRTFIKMAQTSPVKVRCRNFTADLQVGQFIASKVDLANLWRCNRKTATRIVKEFNQMGILHSVPNHSTTIHSLKCLSVWFYEVQSYRRQIRNPFFDFNPTVIMPKSKADITPKIEDPSGASDHDGTLVSGEASGTGDASLSTRISTPALPLERQNTPSFSLSLDSNMESPRVTTGEQAASVNSEESTSEIANDRREGNLQSPLSYDNPNNSVAELCYGDTANTQNHSSADASDSTQHNLLTVGKGKADGQGESVAVNSQDGKGVNEGLPSYSPL